MTRLILLPLMLLPSACGYSPPARVDQATPAYKTDLATCDGSVRSAVNKQNAKTGVAWFSSPVRRWGQIDEGVRTCMADKGYGRLRWCTDDEIKSGGRSGDVVVTASGLQCTDPPERRRAS